MRESLEKIRAGKRESRKQLASLPIAQKLALWEKLRDRSRVIAASSLRQRSKLPSSSQSCENRGD